MKFLRASLPRTSEHTHVSDTVRAQPRHTRWREESLQQSGKEQNKKKERLVLHNVDRCSRSPGPARDLGIMTRRLAYECSRWLLGWNEVQRQGSKEIPLPKKIKNKKLEVRRAEK